MSPDEHPHAQAGTRSRPLLIRKVEVARMLGCSVYTVDRWVKEGNFPKPIFVSDRAPARWRLRDVEAWLEKARVRRRTKSFPGTRNLLQRTQGGGDAA
jgi:predicted DNA-binding transcriptional regulator AlpA